MGFEPMTLREKCSVLTTWEMVICYRPRYVEDHGGTKI